MKKLLTALLLLASSTATATPHFTFGGEPDYSMAPSMRPAVSSRYERLLSRCVFERGHGGVACLVMTAPALAMPGTILAGGFSGGGGGSSDPFVGNGWAPASGTATVTGKLTVNTSPAVPIALSDDGAGSNTLTGTGNFVVGAASGGNNLNLKSGTFSGLSIAGNAKTVAAAGAWTITGANDATQLKVVANATQTSTVFQLFQSDGTTNLFSVSNAGKGIFKTGIDAAGQISNSSGYTGTFFDDFATATVKATPVAGTGWTFDVPTAKGYFFQVNSAEVFKIGSGGAITPSDAATGAASLVNVIRQAYVIDFGAFSAGIDQTSAQAMTGVAFGDGCVVGTATDQSASFGALSVIVTSAGNIKISVSPISTTSTANPASDTFTVSCIRTL